MKKSDDAIREAAKSLFEEEGRIEIDEGAEVSHGDDPGAYVQAWVWVYYDDVNRENAFNPKLAKWLNDRDYVTGDWPHNISDAVLAEADLEFADPPLTFLDELGWQRPALPSREDDR